METKINEMEEKIKSVPRNEIAKTTSYKEFKNKVINYKIDFK
jgi:hypothetical protein